MALEFKVPELGENVDKGDVVRVMVKAGDVVAVDQAIFELETDKATIEVPSTVAGKVTNVAIKPGDKVKPGQLVLTVEEGAGASVQGPESSVQSPESQAQDVTAPATAEAQAPAPQETAAVQEAAEEPTPASVQETKAPAQQAPTAPPSGEPKAPAAVVNIASGRSSEPGRSGEPRGSSPGDAKAAGGPALATAPLELAAGVPAAPSVRRFARELGVDIAQVPGTGPGGRIGQEDVSAYVKGQLTAGAAAPAAKGYAPLPDFSKWGGVDRKPMSNIRRKTAEHLTQAWQAPHVTQNDKADLSGFEAFRETFGPRVEKAGGKLTITAVVIKLLAAAIDRFPQFASSVDMANESIVYKQYRHIGVAVDTPNGLLVPVIRDVTSKTITQIAIELGTLSQKARDKKLSLDEMSGGVMSVTNLGGIGGTSFTPIVNQPEVAILGMSRGGIEPVWHDGQFVPRPMLPLSLSYDHRVIDGADAARFLRFVAEALEQPLTMLL
ncbi:MAG TPA: 2-oxo acid dehydrogenase subunit E2 [Vicinamibacterales bacterium]|nr:2-oxo acid dehydrogenase subunit E2 [Vicinamibacterales bacterium]